MKVLVKKESVEYSSETIEYKGNKFLIASRNGNCYSEVRIEIYTKNGDLACIATGRDIPNTIYISYVEDDDKRLQKNAANLKAAEDYVKAIYG